MTDVPHDCIQFLEKKKFVYIWGSKLPHWFQDNKAVFVTFRLGDSLPQAKIDELLDIKKKMLSKSQDMNDVTINQQYNVIVVAKMEEWIDAGYGSCILADEKIRKIVEDSIYFFDGVNYTLHSFVIMPNHVHILLSPIGSETVVDCIGKIKRFTAVRINNILNKDGKVWQKGTFDRLVRNSIEFERYWDYIVKNPRYLPVGSYTLYTRK